MTMTEGQCPRCASPLAPLRWRNVQLHGCAGCGGVGLDYRTTGRILRASDEDVLRLADQAESAAAAPARGAGGAACCPTCSGALRHVHLSGVEFGHRDEHGTWFDAREFRAVAENVARGGGDGGGLETGAAAAAGIGVAAAGAGLAGGYVGMDAMGVGGVDEQERNRLAGDAAETALEVGTDLALESDAAFGAAGAGLEVAGEAAAGVLEAALEVLGGLLDGL